MNKILFSIYSGEYPNQFAGGPNNIIYKDMDKSIIFASDERLDGIRRPLFLIVF